MRQNLETVLQAAGNAMTMLRNSQIGAYVYPVVPSEYDNWRDEQRAWRDSAVLFDQSHHMVDLYVEGPDAVKLMSDLAINTFKNFPVERAKQFVPCSWSGHVIGDGILFYLETNKVVFVGRAPSANWIEHQAKVCLCSVTTQQTERSSGVSGANLPFSYDAGSEYASLDKRGPSEVAPAAEENLKRRFTWGLSYVREIGEAAFNRLRWRRPTFENSIFARHRVRSTCLA